MSFNVAIDGPAGAGKSTVAKAVAAKRNFIYVDTGAMYRTMALYFLRKSVDKNDEAAVNKACMEVSISIAYENGAQQVFLNGENVSGLIRTEEVGNMASATSRVSFCPGSWWSSRKKWPGNQMWSWTAGISAPACCRRPM